MRPVLAKHGLSVSQFPSYQSGVVSVETILMHSSGQWLSGEISAPVSKQDAQGVGSATTYCRRYSLAAVVGIAQEDDDANSAVGHSPKHQSNQVQEEPKVEHDWIGYIANISKAPDMESLKRAYGSAYRIAEAENSAKMIARLDAAKDKRKAELTQQEQKSA